MMLNTPRINVRVRAMSPCYGCTDRVVGCHGGCERYAAYKQAESEEYMKARDAYMGEYMAELNEVRGKMRTINRQHGRRKDYGYQ